MRRLFLSCLLVLGLCAVAAPAHAARNQALTFEAPRDLLDPAKRAAALRELDGMGVRALRVILTWQRVAPQAEASQRPAGVNLGDPGSYAWGEYEPLMAAARERGWDVVMTVSGPVPKWATQAGRDHLTRPRAGSFAEFMTAVGRKFGDQVDTWSIWNEPNQPQFLRPQFVGGRPVSPGIYRGLFLAGQRGLEKAGQGADRMLLGETSPRGTGSVVAPLTFLRGTLCLDTRYRKRKGCSRLEAQGYAHHAYSTRLGPFFTPPGPNDVTIGVLRRLNRALDRAGRAGAVRKGMPIHLTEFGVQSTPDPVIGVSLARQPEYYAISERLARGNPRVRAFSQYLLTDDEATGPDEYGGFESGLRFAGGGAKPALRAFPLPLSVLRSGGGKVSIMGGVRPAGGRTSVDVQVADRGRSFRNLRAVRTDARGWFTLRANDRAGRRWRLRWEAPDGTVRTGPPIRAYRRP